MKAVSLKTAIRWGTECRVALSMFVTLQACANDHSLGYWVPDQPDPGPASQDIAMRDAGGTAASSGLADASTPRPSASRAEEEAGTDSTVGVPKGSAPALGDACQLARAVSPALEVTVVDSEAKLYNFANDAQFSPGRYRVAYVDGCRRYENTTAWTLHASVLAARVNPTSRAGSYLIRSGTKLLDLAPGTAGIFVGPGDEPAGAFATYAECVAANRNVAPVDFPFEGGTLGVMNAGDGGPVVKVPGESVGGRSPTFSLTRLDPCP